MRRTASITQRGMVLVLMMMAGMVTGYLVASKAMGSGGSFMQWVEHELTSYWSDTFRTGLIFGVLLLGMLGAVPELVARMRVREDDLQGRLLRAESEAQRLARHQAEGELRLLQAQVQPHFLYNTLANVRYLIQKNSPDALRMTDALIEYLRTAVPDIRADRVTLGQEVDHVQHYLTIMEMRMQGRLRFVIDVPDCWRARQIPPLVLLTLVENAVKHGVARAVDGGEITLRATTAEHCNEAGEPDLVIEVSDTGPGTATADTPTLNAGTGTGLNNVRERLRLLAGERASLALLPRELPGTGMTARIILPANSSHMSLESA
jgi:LytS/YehU family sensor histidine kinase